LEDQEARTKGDYFDTIENEVLEDEKIISGHLEFSNKLSSEIEDLMDKKYVFDQSNRLINFDSMNMK
jgi:hypothetical protein